uniref:hypothetical protein n=1 Tax=Variovorax sp. BK018 TaxID=3450241 RepID=UPI004039844E
MDKTQWSEPLKAEGVSLRLYQSGDLQLSNPGRFLGPGLISVLVGETRPPAARPKTAILLASDIVRELDLTSMPPVDAQAPAVLPRDAFTKPVVRDTGERRFILKIGVHSETLNHLPMAWATNQYWLGANAVLIDTSDGKAIWQGACRISLDPDDKSRQVTNEQLTGTNGLSLFTSAVRSATRQCAAAMNKSTVQASSG